MRHEAYRGHEAGLLVFSRGIKLMPESLGECSIVSRRLGRVVQLNSLDKHDLATGNTCGLGRRLSSSSDATGDLSSRVQGTRVVLTRVRGPFTYFETAFGPRLASHARSTQH